MATACSGGGAANNVEIEEILDALARTAGDTQADLTPVDRPRAHGRARRDDEGGALGPGCGSLPDWRWRAITAASTKPGGRST